MTRAFGLKEAGMSVTNHVFRRGAVYTWRRRIPAGACQGGRSAVLQLSLQPCGRREAQRLAATVVAESDAVFWAMERHGLSPAAARALPERTIRAAQAQFARAELAAMNEAQAGAWERTRASTSPRVTPSGCSLSEAAQPL